MIYHYKELSMLRLAIVLFILFLLTACDVGDSMREASKNNPTSHARVIAADSGCMGCHAVSVTVVGPAWKLVAKKYKDDPGAKAFLIHKIKKGGKGNWNEMTGGKIMPAHEDRMSDEDISKLVDYILAL